MSGMRTLLALAVIGTTMITTMSKADDTPDQRWACEQDAFKFCRSEIPSVSRVTACMTKNLKKLSRSCRAQFK